MIVLSKKLSVLLFWGGSINRSTILLLLASVTLFYSSITSTIVLVDVSALSSFAAAGSHFRQRGTNTNSNNVMSIDVSETAPRNIKGLQGLVQKGEAKVSVGEERQSQQQEGDLIQTCPGWKLVTDPIDEHDWSVSTTRPLSPNDVVVKVPSNLLLSSTDVKNIDNNNINDNHSNAQQPLVKDIVEQRMIDEGYGDEISSFWLFVVLLQEVELGQSSKYFEWIDSLPRRFYNGIYMTSACFDCLPPFVRYLSERERDTFETFQTVLVQHLSSSDEEEEGGGGGGGGVISETTCQNTQLLKWAYCVVVTRSIETPASSPASSIRIIAPMADMFNHIGDYDNQDVQLTFDDEWNCVVYATRHISAGSNLRFCYGDPTNPSLFFARYGFLDKSSPATFCKILHLQDEMYELQMDFSSLLFYKDGGVSEEVWDLLLYSILKKQQQQEEQTGPEQLQGFYDAYMSGDTDTKNMYHQHYFEYTLQALRDHVDGLLAELDDLSALSKTYDIAQHPRLSLIMQHNNFVQDTFLKVKDNLDQMSVAS